MEHVKECEPYLILLYKTHPSQKCALLESSDSKQINTLCEILLNLVNGNFRIDEKHLNNLESMQNVIKALLKKSISLKMKKLIFIDNLDLVHFLLHTLIQEK